MTSAVSVSGFSDQYLFYGFLTKKENQLNNILKNLCNINYSIVFFIPASKIKFYISKFREYFFDRKILIAKEMTKIHEEFIRSGVQSIKSLPENLKGELTIVLVDKNKSVALDPMLHSIEEVISFAKEFSTHSKTIENTPEDSKIFASLKILFLSASFFPLDLNLPFSD